MYTSSRLAWLRYQLRHMTSRVVMAAVLGGILVGLFIDWSLTNPYVDEVYAQEVVEETQQEVRVEVVIDWSKARIEQEIRAVFPEDAETAIKIARCESGLVATAQSNHMWRGERERSFGIYQIHYDSWHNKAIQLGLDRYQTDVQENIQMARYIYDNAGQRWTDWSCYTKKMI